MDPQQTNSQPSLLYLPATTYSSSPGKRSRQLSLATDLPSRSSASRTHNEVSPSPDDFYRQHHDRFPNPGRAVLSQNSLVVQDLRSSGTENKLISGGAVRSSVQNGLGTSTPRRNRPSQSQADNPFAPSALYEASKSTPTLHTHLRSRKASFKDLVARFDASNESEIPPVPLPPTRTDSKTASPTQSLNRPRPPPMTSGVASPTTSQMAPSRRTQRSQSNVAALTSPPRRPLFGEITTPGLPGSSIGYGIINPRRRSGSAGSPMHSPNPMFPRKSDEEDSALSPISPTAWYKHSVANLNGDQLDWKSELPRPVNHRRANSDFSPSWNASSSKQSTLTHARNGSAHVMGNSNPTPSNRDLHSRIPVSSRRPSTTSESGHSSPSSRSASKMGKYTAAKPTSGSAIPTPKGATKPTTPKRTAHAPIRIKSPGSRPYAPSISQGQKSPSLRANIIAPPPKVSPPLRSSRPRLPVSSASTAASRAKMAEKYASMQKANQEKRSAGRKASRPPELHDVDFNERRLRITQALTRSRQGAELRGELSQRRASVTTSRSNSVSSTQFVQTPDTPHAQANALSLPALIVEEPSVTEPDAVKTSEPLTPATPNPALPGSFPADEPSEVEAKYIRSVETSGLNIFRAAKPEPPSLNTYLNAMDADGEPSSAVTAGTMETEGTTIDAEPQSEFTRPKTQSPSNTMFSQIMRLRSSSPSSHSSTDSSSHEDEHDLSDQADQESVQLMLRKTNYLDDSDPFEHVELTTAQKGEPEPPNTETNLESRNSWASIVQEQTDSPEEWTAQEHGLEQTATHERLGVDIGDSTQRRPEIQHRYWHDLEPENLRSTMASDAYTIVNFVLQQNTASGIVDADMADLIYNRVLSQSPKLTEEGTLDSQKLEQLAREVFEEYSERQPADHAESSKRTTITRSVEEPNRPSFVGMPDEDGSNSQAAYGPSSWTNRPSYLGHRQKASLDSAEDWADTSPSVGSWMQFATSPTDGKAELMRLNATKPQDVSVSQPTVESDQEDTYSHQHATNPLKSGTHAAQIGPELAPRPPSKSPPLPPLPHVPFAPQPRVGFPYTASSIPGSQVFTKTVPPQVPRRVTSLSQLSHTPPENGSWSQGLSTDRSSDGRPSMEHPSIETGSERSSPTPEERRLKQRRHVLGEIVDTEARFEKDMKVLSDIYRETAFSTLAQEDIKILFGNADQVLMFVTDFLTSLKQGAKPTYVIDRSAKHRIDQDGRDSQMSDSSKAKSDTASMQHNRILDSDKDRQTRLGAVFESNLTAMGNVYAEYIRNHDAANKKLQSIQKNFGVHQWLKECKDNSTDLTSAWDLDSLMVKPVQRILKYPLLLAQLIEATAEDHPDMEALRKSLRLLTELNARINEAKKQAELVEQALTRKRKESDVRTGFSKALGRRTEKLKQHVGMSEMFEDREYSALKVDFLENSSHLVVVNRDIQIYEEAIASWISKMRDLAAAGETWAGISQTKHTEAESKLHQFASLVHRICTIALPDHLSKVQSTVTEPMEKAFKMLESLANDPKGLLQKRDKRLIDYARFKNMKDRGEKLDKKSIERIEQWEAMNTEAKIRIRKLLSLTQQLVQIAQDNYVKLHLAWLDMCNRKFSAALSISLDKLDLMDIEREWQEDFDYHEALALSLSICNGSLLADAVNMVNLLTPSSTLNGDESPRHYPWTSGNKRSISLNSDSFSALPLDPAKRSSGSFTGSPLTGITPEGASSIFSNGRLRAASTTSAQTPRTPDASFRVPSLPFQHSSMRPLTSSGHSVERSTDVPRLSVDAPSPSLGLLRADTPPGRPDSGSTIFPASGVPTQNNNNQSPNNSDARQMSGILSSAITSLDSPSVVGSSPFDDPGQHRQVLFTAASVYEFNIDRSRREAGYPYLTYVAGEIFDVIGERGELWLARNQDDPHRQIGWIWNKHFAKLAE